MRNIKKTFEIVGVVDKGNGKEDYPIKLTGVYMLKDGESMEDMNSKIIPELKQNAKLYYTRYLKIKFHGIKSITEVK